MADAVNAISETCDPTADFGAPQPLQGLGSFGHEAYASLEDDELTIYFGYRQPQEGDSFLGMATRPDLASPFGPIGQLVVSDHSATPRPAVTHDGLRLLVLRWTSPAFWPEILSLERSTRDQPWSKPEYESIAIRTSALYIAADDRAYWGTRDTDLVGPVQDSQLVFSPLAAFDQKHPTFLTSLNTSDLDEQDPVVGFDGLEIFYTSMNGDPLTLELRYATRSAPADAFEPQELGGALAGSQLVPNWYSEDRCRLYVTSYEDGDRAELMVARRGSP